MLCYSLKDTLGEKVIGSFYEPELSKVIVTDDMEYRVDKVMKNRRDQVLASWLEWPRKYASWIPTNSLKDYRNPTN